MNYESTHVIERRLADTGSYSYCVANEANIRKVASHIRAPFKKVAEQLIRGETVSGIVYAYNPFARRQIRLGASWRIIPKQTGPMEVRPVGARQTGVAR